MQITATLCCNFATAMSIVRRQCGQAIRNVSLFGFVLTTRFYDAGNGDVSYPIRAS
jgi:hypothetical protein